MIMHEVVTYELLAYDEHDRMVHFIGISSFAAEYEEIAIAAAVGLMDNVVHYEFYNDDVIVNTRVDKVTTRYAGTVAHENFVDEDRDMVAEFF